VCKILQTSTFILNFAIVCVIQRLAIYVLQAANKMGAAKKVENDLFWSLSVRFQDNEMLLLITGKRIL